MVRHHFILTKRPDAHFVRIPAVPYVNVTPSGLGYSLLPSSISVFGRPSVRAMAASIPAGVVISGSTEKKITVRSRQVLLLDPTLLQLNSPPKC
jgi:hypothetical protein